MNRSAALGAAALLAILAGCATSEAPRMADVSTGYLDQDVLRRLAGAVPPPPDPNSATDQTDRAVSARYGALENTDRWLMATAHAELRPPLALQHFDCALNLRLGSNETPNLDRLMARVFHDAQAVAEQVKARAARPRPIGDDPDRRPCQVMDAEGRTTPSYPSDGAAVAAAYAEAFAILEPERADAVRRIGREIGVSGLVCAMHYPSDVAAGETIGRAVAADVAATWAFQADLPGARAELRTARATGLTSPACAAERAVLATRLP